MTFTTIQQSFFFGLLIIITVAFLTLIQDFLFPIFWAIVFAIIFYPIHLWWLRILKNRSALASVVTILTISILIFAPLFLVGSLAIKESIAYYQLFSVQNGNGSELVLGKLSSALDLLEQFNIDREALQEQVTSVAKSASSWLGSQALSIGQNTFRAMLLFFVMLYILFFVLKDGTQLEKRLIEILPLGDAKERRLFKKFTSTTRATIKGTFVIAIIQGVIGGLIFMLAGVGAPFLWGTLMGVLSVIPAVGPAIVWLPVGILLIASGSLWQGVLVLVGGAAIISLLDNILRPILIGKDTKMPDVVILLSTLGGLTLFGISGFVIGPIIAAFFLATWQMFEEEFKNDLETRG